MSRPRGSATPAAVVLLAASLLFLWRLGGHDVWAPDEPYFAEGAREMVVDGQWAVPHVNGVVTTDKPPFFFWSIAVLSLAAGGVTPFTARLPSVLAALGTLALTYRLGRRYFGPRTATLSIAVLATSFLFWDKARWSQTDALLCCWIWVALSAFAAFRDGDAAGRRAGLLFWLAVALAVLTKGPVGLLLPLGAALLVLAWDRSLARWRGFAPLLGPLLFASAVGAWMLLATTSGQGEYSVSAALREHFLDRAVHGMHHAQPPWYYLHSLPVNLLPWTGLLPGAVLLAWRRRRPSDRLLLVVAAFVPLVFTISTEKRDLYVLPAFPAYALLAATLVAAVCRWDEPAPPSSAGLSRRWVTVPQCILGILLMLIALALPLAAPRFPEAPLAIVMVGALVLGAGGAAVLFLALRDRPLATTTATAAVVAALYLLMVTFAYPALEPRKSARSFSVTMAEATAATRARGLPVLSYSLGNLPEHFAFHTGGLYTEETDDPERLRAHLERPEQVFMVVDGDRLASLLPPDLLARTCVVASARLSRQRVELVTNVCSPGNRPLLAEPGLR